MQMNHHNPEKKTSPILKTRTRRDPQTHQGEQWVLFPGACFPQGPISAFSVASFVAAMALSLSMLRGAFRLTSSLSSFTLSSRALVCLPCAGSKVSPSFARPPFGGGFGVFLDEKDVDCSFLGTKGFASSAAAKGGGTPQQAYEYEVRLLFSFSSKDYTGSSEKDSPFFFLCTHNVTTQTHS